MATMFLSNWDEMRKPSIDISWKSLLYLNKRFQRTF
jgi:hypothetical protein